MPVLHFGDCLEYMHRLDDGSIDAVVTDPPYGWKFMNKTWDYDVPKIGVWKECLRILKPGGYALICCGTRTQHRMAVNVEDAGFEIRDLIAWVYGQGFPKSLNVSKEIDRQAKAKRVVIGTQQHPTSNDRTGNKSPYQAENSHLDGNFEITIPATNEAKQWDGWGTALKPAMELWTLARKPISEKTIAKNILKWGVGGMNIDSCRVEIDGEVVPINKLEKWSGFGQKVRPDYEQEINQKGRFPANFIHDGSNEVVELFPNTKRSTDGGFHGDFPKDRVGERDIYGDSGSASRFFYCAKASKSERGEGNNHTTVKPIKLMKYLVKLVCPPNGLVIDPYMGSGTTGMACVRLGFNFAGCENDADYFLIAKNRIENEVLLKNKL